MKLLILPLATAALLAGPVRATEPGTRLPRLMLAYESAFAGVAAHADAKPIDWSVSNALVGALQGHAGHWRRPAPAPSSPNEAPRQREGPRP